MKNIKTKHIITLLASVFATMTYAHAANLGQQVKEEFAPGRIIVMPHDGLTQDEFQSIMKAHSGKAKKVGQSNMYIVDIPANSERAIVEKLNHDPRIKFAELDIKVPHAAIPNDPGYGSEWHLTKIGADVAYDTTQGAGVTIAILDSGVEPGHPDLVASLVPGYNFYDNNTNTSDVCGHGTAVAGSAAATSNNGIGVVGVAGQAKIMPIRIAYNDPTSGCWGYTSMIVNGITYAADHGVRVANVSYGNMTGQLSLQNAAAYMKGKNGLVFVAAGNDSSLLTSAPTNSFIVVAATDENDNKPYWSSYGDAVSLSAPGTNIYTTSYGSGYGGHNGTSFASPNAAGVAALVMSANPKLSATEVENILFTTAVDLNTPGRDQYSGYGRVNAGAAVNAAKVAVPFSDTIAPTVSVTNLTEGSTVSGTVSVTVNASDNVGIKNVQLFANGTSVAIDTSSPYTFSWDSKGVANGMANIYAIATDTSSNQTQSATVSVNVSNVTTPVIADTTPPVVRIVNPVAGSVSGSVSISANASDDSGAAGITQSIFIDNALVKTGTGSSVAYSWNTRKASVGNHIIVATAKDKAGNVSSASVTVSVK